MIAGRMVTALSVLTLGVATIGIGPVLAQTGGASTNGTPVSAGMNGTVTGPGGTAMPGGQSAGAGRATDTPRPTMGTKTAGMGGGGTGGAMPGAQSTAASGTTATPRTTTGMKTAGTGGGGTAGAQQGGPAMGTASPHPSQARTHMAAQSRAASHGMTGRTDADAQNPAVAQLNRESLQAARNGERFAPPTAVR